MNITVWDLFHYIYKWKWLIILVTVGSVVLAVRYTDSHQTYNSKTVIQYNDSCISEGQTPDNKEFDPYEIVSPDIITSAIKDLSLNRSVDYIRSKVEITGIVPEAETAMKEAKTKPPQIVKIPLGNFVFGKTISFSLNGANFTVPEDIPTSFLAKLLEAASHGTR